MTVKLSEEIICFTMIIKLIKLELRSSFFNHIAFPTHFCVLEGSYFQIEQYQVAYRYKYYYWSLQETNQLPCLEANRFIILQTTKYEYFGVLIFYEPRTFLLTQCKI